MNSFIIYLLEVSICFALFYSVYVLFKGDTFYYLKRFYLIFTVLISLIIPQLSSSNLPVDIEQFIVTKPTQEMGNVSFQDTFEKVVFGQIPENIFTSESNLFSLLNLLGIIYLIGVMYFLYRLLRNLFHIYQLYKQNEKESHENFRIILLSNEYPTFSFFNFIFLNKKNLSDDDKNDVILHEIVHVKQRHSIDILFIEICRILFWFNPIIWFYKSSIVKVHECLADQYFVENKPNNIVDYQSLLLKQYLSKIHIELAHPFNYSLIKYRIKMMTKNKSKWWAKYKLILALPIVIFSLVAFSNADINLEDKIGNNGKEMEPEPEGMVFIPQGSFVMKRNVGESISERNVSVEAFWMKETEVSVKEYYEYLEAVKDIASDEEYKLLLPNFDKAPFENYFTNKKYKDFPVVGISYKQAAVFCAWKTKEEKNKLPKNRRKFFPDYRLPLETEWIYASFGGIRPEQIELPEISALTKVSAGKPNDWGVYHAFDNISEWTANKLVKELDAYVKNESNYTIMAPGWKIWSEMNYTDSITGKEMKIVNATRYLQSDIEPQYKIVRGNNYKDLVPDGSTALDYHQSFDYVGFRYVRSYMGIQNK